MTEKLQEVLYCGNKGTFQHTKGRFLVVKRIGTLIDTLDPRFDLRNHSPDGFGWGYNGSGSAQLALAILSDALPTDVILPQSRGKSNRKITDHDVIVEFFYEQFKVDVVSKLPEDRFAIYRSAVLNWLNNRLRRDFVLTLGAVSKSCAMSASRNEGGKHYALHSYSNGQLFCSHCKRIWDRGEDNLTTGDGCPSCSNEDWYCFGEKVETSTV